MVQVMTVTATTAGYVADSIKATQRLSGNSEIEQIKREAIKKTAQKRENLVSSVSTAVTQTSLSLHFMTAGQQHNPQATLEEVIDAYEENEGRGEA